ncbi:MAG: MBL fold metallo-hydrolase [Chloroflexota bacterium]|nr:MBL fold metallo-hydrolase [Chloroflexota bacterium]
MIERLAEIGIGRADVNVVVQTHLHADHCGWLLHEDGVTLGFPNATVFLHERELTYWTTSVSDGTPMSAFVRSRIEPMRAAGRMSLFDREFAVSAAVTALPTPGHTPGHCSVLVVSDGAHALLLGDVAHHPTHLEHHDWLPRIDLDPSESVRSRGKMAAVAASHRAVVTAPHMPILTRRGRIEFIRLIRSDRLLRLPGREIELPEAVVHKYVTATLDVARGELTVHHRGRRILVRRFKIEA